MISLSYDHSVGLNNNLTKMYKTTACLLTFITAALAAGDLIILSSPKDIVFKGHEHVDQKTLKEIYSASLGFSVEQSSSWSGMYLSGPFNMAKAIVTVVIDGVNDIGLDIGHHFPIHTNEDEEVTYNSLQRRITERYPTEKPNLVRIDLKDGVENVNLYKAFSDVKPKTIDNTKYLSHSVDEDQEFLNELGLLDGIISEIENGVVKRDYVPDVYWFVLSGLHAVSDVHGENSTVTREAKLLLKDLLVRLNDAFKISYKNQVLSCVVTSDASHTRYARSLLEDLQDSDSNKTNINLAKVYNADYPVIFNIILWFTVAMVFALLATSLVIGGMDPGRDSIIYRMTSNRMKKDN